jgi:hypothetical protein
MKGEQHLDLPDEVAPRSRRCGLRERSHTPAATAAGWPPTRRLSANATTECTLSGPLFCCERLFLVDAIGALSTHTRTHAHTAR